MIFTSFIFSIPTVQEIASLNIGEQLLDFFFVLSLLSIRFFNSTVILATGSMEGRIMKEWQSGYGQQVEIHKYLANFILAIAHSHTVCLFTCLFPVIVKIFST